MASFRSNLIELLGPPPQKSALSRTHFKLYMQTAIVRIESAHNNGDLYPMIRVRREWVPVELEIQNQAITLGTDFDLGLYTSADWSAGPGSVVDVDRFASGLDLSVAREDPFRLVGWEQAVDGILSFEEIIEPDPGSVPGEEWDLTFTANVVGTGAGSVVLRLIYGANY